MPKVILNKTTKIKGKGLILAGIEVEVTANEEKTLKANGFIGELKKASAPTNEKEIKDLVAKVIELEKQIADSSNDALKAEIETLKAEVNAKDGEIETLKAEVNAKDGEIETLKAEVNALANPDLTATKKK